MKIFLDCDIQTFKQIMEDCIDVKNLNLESSSDHDVGKLLNRKVSLDPFYVLSSVIYAVSTKT